MVKKKINSSPKNYLKVFNVFKTHTLISIIVTIGIVAATGTALLVLNLFNNNANTKCTVRFDSSGGTVIEERIVKCGEIISNPELPTKDGFKFKHWEYNGKEYDFKSTVKVDILLTAVYEVEDGVETVTITFDTSGANEIKPAEIKKGTAMTKPADPVMPGYKFIGWYKDYAEYDFSTAVNENITLKAKWEENNGSSNNKKGDVKTNTSSNKYKCRV